MTLDDHLHACVRETSRVPGSIGARRNLHLAVRGDPALAAEASAKLPALQAVADQCFIARTQADALKGALQT